MLTTTADKLKIGDVFTTHADQGAVWFRVEAIEQGYTLLDVLGRVVDCNPDSDYEVGDSEWMNLAQDDEVMVRI